MKDFWTTADGIPALPGAYVLAINLSELVVLSIGRKPSAPLAPGCYLYLVRPRDPAALRRASRDTCDTARRSGGTSTT
jgi:hypothetical protein